MSNSNQFKSNSNQFKSNSNQFKSNSNQFKSNSNQFKSNSNQYKLNFYRKTDQEIRNSVFIKLCVTNGTMEWHNEHYKFFVINMVKIL